jgi:isopenicillin N synthase-like dioxygenase
LHRVVAQTGTTHRYSLPFFFDGNQECRLVPFDGVREGEKIGTVEEHMLERFVVERKKESNRQII